MKKFFALLCTMAMVMSLFSGIVLANNTWKLEVKVDNDTLIFINTADPDFDKFTNKTYVITGTVTGGGSVPSGIVRYELQDASGNPVVGASSFSADGKIRLEIPADSLTNKATYKLYVYPTSSGVGKNDDKYSAADKVDIKVQSYKVEFDQDLSNLSYLSNTYTVLTGKIVDSQGKGVSGRQLTVEYDDEVDPAAKEESTVTSTQGVFALALGRIKVGGKLEFKDKATDEVLATAKIKAGSFTMEDMITSGKDTIEATKIDGTLKRPSSNSKFLQDDHKAEVVATITGVPVLKSSVSGDELISGVDHDSDNTLYKEVKVKFGSDVIFVGTGVATVKLNWQDKLVGEYNITVGAPGNVNILGLVDQTVGSKEHTLTVKVWDGSNYVFPNNVDVKVTAPGISYDVKNATTSTDKVTYDKTKGEVKFTLVPKELGEILVTVKAYKDSVTPTLVYGETSATAKVTGWTVTSSTDEVVVNTTNTVTVTLTDKDGNGVNNASVYLVRSNVTPADGTIPTNVAKVESSSTNIQNGQYTFKDLKLTAVDNYKLAIYQGTTLKYVFADFLVVKGEEVYTLEVDKTAVLAGTTNNFSVLVKDAEGNIVPAYQVVAYVDGSKTATNADTSWNSDKKYDVTGVLATKSLVLEAQNTDKTKIGRVEIEVVKPVLEFDKTIVTDGVAQDYNLTIVNPIDGKTVAAQLDITTKGLKSAPVFKNASGNTVTLNTMLASSEFKFNILADAKAAADLAADETPSITFKVKLANSSKWVEDVLTMDVKPAILTVDKTTLMIGTNNDVTLTLTDANGNPLANKTLKMNNGEIGATDEQGQVVYSVLPAGSGAVTFSYTNDAGKDVKVVATAVRDTVAPEIIVDELGTVKTDTITLTATVKDNVKVAEVYVNGNKVLFVPGAETTIRAKVALVPGVNEIEIYAFDAAGNAGTQIVTVIRELPTVVKLAIGSADATIDGTPAAGVAPYLKNNSTMVPFRFIGEALGAYVEWNAEAQTVTLSLDGTTVVLTIGSTTAFVNGEAKSMPVAPEITDGRTMVPLRFVGEALGAVVDYNAATGGITVTR